MSDVDLQASENLEQTQETIEPATKATRSELTAVHEAANQLLGQLATIPNGDLVGEIITNALKLLRDETNRGDVKLIDKSFKELRYALKVFAPYRDTRKVSIFGSARTAETHEDYKQAASFGKKMAEAGWMVITGAGGGIMAAGHGGAGADPSFGLAIRLPFEQATNTFIANDPKLINFKYFFTRKLMFVRSSHAIALFPGGFGTMDEGFEVLTLIQTGKSAPMPIVFVDRPGGDYWSMWQDYVEKQLLNRGLIGEADLALYKITDDVDVAVKEVRQFYRNFHSVRYYRDTLIMRVHRAPSASVCKSLTAKYREILMKGEIESSSALPVEKDEPAIASLPRVIMNFNKRDHGRLRMLINDLNEI